MDAVARATHLSIVLLSLASVCLHRLSLRMPRCLLSGCSFVMLRHYYVLHPHCADCIVVRRRPALAEAAPQRQQQQ